MEKYRTNKNKQIEESGITPAPQIKALLGMIKTSEPPDEIRLNVMRAAREKLEKRPFRQKLIGKVRLYFTKRRLGLEVNASERLEVYSLLVITLFLITVGSSAAYYQLFQPLTVKPSISQSNFTNKPQINNIDKTNVSSSPKDTISSKTEPSTIINQPDKVVENIKPPLKKAIPRESSSTFILPEDVTSPNKSKTYLETKEQDSLALNNTQILENPESTNSITRSKSDPLDPSAKTTTVNETADLASMKTIYVKDLGMDDWSIMLRNEIIVAIEKSNQWQFAEKENADVAFRLNKKGDLLLVNREGTILWLNSNLTGEKLAPKKAAQQILKEVKEATKNLASKPIKK
jgi:hypothetical protein